MRKGAYYNEIDPFAAQWLRNLIAAGHIAPGDVDERSIEDITPDDLQNYTQCHFFAGIGVRSYSLRRAGWPDKNPVWTGSCPCQPFGAAGKKSGFDDKRHLWPAWFRLISQCCPGIVVASKYGLSWLDFVRLDMETAEYAFAAVDLCAVGVGAPHIRQRLFWVADADGMGRLGRGAAAIAMNPASQSHLRDVAHLAGWPTVTTIDNNQVRGQGAAANAPQRGTTLGGAARLATWPTPSAQDSDHHPRNVLARVNSSSKRQLMLAHAAGLTGPCRLTVFGVMQMGSSAEMESGG